MVGVAARSSRAGSGELTSRREVSGFPLARLAACACVRPVMLRGMAESITVAIADLRSALSRVLDATEACLGPEVSLAVDHYWHLPVEDAFDLTSEPSRFTVGQVSDDLDEVVRDEPDGIPEAAWHDLSHLIGVLRALEFTARS